MRRDLPRACALAATFITLTFVGGAPARAQPSPVTLEISGVFENAALLGDGYGTLVVHVRNTSRSTFRGDLELTVREWQHAPERHSQHVDLPGGESRRVLVTTFLGDSGTSIDARFMVDGVRVAAASESVSYSPAGGAVVVLSDPPRLRAELLDLSITVPGATPSYYPGAGPTERDAEVPVGVVSLDSRTGDPILPDDALGWSRVHLLVVSAPMLSRIGGVELAAMEAWIRGGGHVLVFPRTDADLALPFLRAHVGVLSRAMFSATPGLMVPPSDLGALHCPEGTVGESFGCTSRVGHGAVHVASWDGAAPPLASAPATRALIGSIATRAAHAELDAALVPFGVGRDSFERPSWYNSAPSFARLRSALDPNEGYRPALGLVAILLLLYVIAVGPLNFRFVQRRNQPTLALFTTPALAFGCVCLMLGAGYLGKGVLMRYRRVELVDVVEGERIATARRYTGFFYTRPASLDHRAPERGRVMRLASGSGADGEHRIGGEGPVLAGLRGGLWETVFVREDRVVDLGGALEFVLDERRLAALTNRSTTTLRGAIVIDGGGVVYAVGDVAPGATVPIPRGGVMTLAPAAVFEGSDDPALLRLVDAMHLPADMSPYLGGTAQLVGSLVRSSPIVYATLDPEGEPLTNPTFAHEADLRIVALHPRLPRAPIAPMLAGSPRDESE